MATVPSGTPSKSLFNDDFAPTALVVFVLSMPRNSRSYYLRLLGKESAESGDDDPNFNTKVRLEEKESLYIHVVYQAYRVIWGRGIQYREKRRHQYDKQNWLMADMHRMVILTKK
ncbi:hypothetical protein OH492_08640 [Vibrio chagasii]|nr:hypothetical protein [Vibrio chagasii]